MTALDKIKSFMGSEFTASPSPFMRWLKPIVLRVEQGALEFEYTVRAEWLNPAGNLHGGVSAAIIDDIIGATVFSLNEPDFYTTINLGVDYFSSAKADEKIIASTHIIKKGRQFLNVQCEIWNTDKSKMLAKGTSNLFKTQTKIEQ